MKLDSQLVREVAKLAHLKLSDDEVSHYQIQLENILKYIQKLDNMPTQVESANSHTEELNGTERPDLAVPSIGAALAVSQAPERSGTYFQVPRIIE